MLNTVGVDIKKLELVEKILLLEKETECEIILQAIVELKKEIDGK
ncbi:hypothetical protein [Bacillus wiedmannii]|nr:hypothetical protein [Bacillus wiedmannii]MCU5599126.1 hypothetical protein [Bacillus wiedmannii]